MLLTIDSSLFVAALREQEPFHRECMLLLAAVREGRHMTVQPLTVLVEVVSAIRRRTGSEELARRVQRDLLALMPLRFVELDARRAEEAMEVASTVGVRGMDAVVMQVAKEFGSTLVTLDEDLARRASSIVTVRAVGSL